MSPILVNSGQMILNQPKVGILGWFGVGMRIASSCPPILTNVVGSYLECCAEKDPEVPVGLVGRVL